MSTNRLVVSFKRIVN